MAKPKSKRQIRFENTCKDMREAVKELGRNYLYSWEAADIIGTNVSNMRAAHQSYINRGAKIPEIIFSEPGKRNIRRPPKMDDVVKVEKTNTGWYYPAGLQVASFRKLKDGRIAYMLR